jgi:hypothetical protein
MAASLTGRLLKEETRRISPNEMMDIFCFQWTAAVGDVHLRRFSRLKNEDEGPWVHDRTEVEACTCGDGGVRLKPGELELIVAFAEGQAISIPKP